MSSRPPDSKSDRPERFWSSRKQDSLPVPPRPSAQPLDEDGLALSGPAAPPQKSRRREEHPVRARLLAKAQEAKAEGLSHEALAPTETSSGREGRDSHPPEQAAHALPQLARALELDDEDLSPLPASLPRLVALDPMPPPQAPPTKAEPEERAAASAEALNQQRVPEPSLPETAPEAASPDSGEDSAGLSRSRAPRALEVAEALERIVSPDPKEDGEEAPQGSRLSPNLRALIGVFGGLSVFGLLGLMLPKLGAEFHPGQLPALAQSAPAKNPGPVIDNTPPARKKEPKPWRILDEQGKPGVRVIKGKVGKLPFLKALEEAGLPRAEAYRAFNAIKELKDFNRCAPSDEFFALVEQNSKKKLLAFEYLSSPENVLQAKTEDNGQLRGKQLDLKVERNQVRRGLVFDGVSFEESAKRSGFDTGLGTVVEKALTGHMSLSELKRGDRLRVIVQEVTVLGDFSRYAGVEAVELLQQGKAGVRFYFFSHPQFGGYFDVNGRAPFLGGWRKPIPTAPITSKFNMKRLHPILKKIMPHTGTDFGAPAGTPMGATAPGVIEFIGFAGPNGNYVRIKHDGGIESGYSHLSRFVPNLKVGDRVDRLQLIGYVGSTGRSTGPHLHFSVKRDGQFIDPESLNLDGMRALPGAQKEAFAEVRAKYDPILDAIPLPAELAPAEESPTTETPAVDHGGDEEGGADEAESPLAAEGKKAPQAAPAAAPAKPAQAGAPAKKVNPSALFLSNSDLLKMQPAKDDGEVSE